MRYDNIHSAYEDMQVLIKMADELSNTKITSEEERDELKSRLAYIKSRLLKIAINTDKVLNMASQGIVAERKNN
ncbi:MAG: hypothetical protein KAS15_01435 [Nanoarchaeota archaeon]|nr:hypothetical protein [Nanoarchaeota archaeon]MCK5629643.1 hypothetical protein [Nanoarchaeota archaeon]